MKFHEIIAIGPIYIHKVATKPAWAVEDLARLVYTLDNDQIMVAGGAGVGDWQTLANLEGAQTITGVKTFSTLPLLTSDPTEDNEAVRKSYLVAYGAGTFIDIDTDQLTIGGQKCFLINPLVTRAPTAAMELANKGYVDDNFVDLHTNQSVDGIKTFTSIPVGPNQNPNTDNEFARKRYVDDQVAAGGGAQVKISADDTTANYLATKLVAGSGVSLTTIGASGTNQTLRVSLSAGATGSEPGEVFVSGTDSSPGYLAAKLVAGSGIDLTIGDPGGDEYVEISYNGVAQREVSFDFTYSVGGAEAGSTLTMPGPDATAAINISRNPYNSLIYWSAYEHPGSGSWTIVPTEDVIVPVNWTSLFPYGYYRNGYDAYFITLQYLQQSLAWKYYKDCTTYNAGSPDGSLQDWDFFPLMEDYIYVPYDDAAQTHVNGVFTPGFYMTGNTAFCFPGFGINYNEKTSSSYYSVSTHATWVSYITRPRWVIGCSPAPEIDTSVQKYFYSKKRGLKHSSEVNIGYTYLFHADGQDPVDNVNYGYSGHGWSWDNNDLVDGDARYVVLKKDTSYTIKLRSIFGRRYMGAYGYGSASAMWYSSYYNVGNGYRSNFAGQYGLQDIWSMYQGAGTTQFRLKGIAKASLNLPA